MSTTKAPRVTWWDRLLIGVAPGWGLRRVRARAAANVIGRYYDAASGGRRTSGWRRPGGDANATPASDMLKLRELSRDLRRNNAWARRGIQVIRNNTVGWGIQPQPGNPTDPATKQALEVWTRWAGSTTCDWDARLPFYGIQRLVMETVVESGEALVLRELGDAEGVPLRLRVLEPDYLDTAKDGAVSGPNGGHIVQGIEFDARGRRVAYWIHKRHPGAGTFDSAESRRWDASEVLHVYQIERPGQRRGVPWLAAAVAKLHDLDDYEDAALMQQKIAACFGAFVQDYEGAGTPLGQLGTGESGGEDDSLELLEPGQIHYLPAGKTVTFATPPSVSDHGPFTASQLRRIAAALGVTYEDLTGDYSQVNFSSARMARIAHWANVHDWRWNMLIPQLCDGVWDWVMDLAALDHEWLEKPAAGWAPPPMPMIEPDKEGLAYSRLVRNGAMTLHGMIRELGGDPATHLAELAAGNSDLDRLGIWLDCDPRRTSQAGLAQQAGTKGGKHASPPPAADGDEDGSSSPT